MAKLGIMPLNLYRPGAPTSGWSDAITTSVQGAFDDLVTTITPAGRQVETVLTTVFDPTTHALSSLSVALRTPTPSPLTIARINRLLAGLSAPNLETYHRTGELVWRFPGTPEPVAHHEGIEGTFAANGWSWTTYGPAFVQAAPVAPVAPVVSPTIAPPAPTPSPAQAAAAVTAALYNSPVAPIPAIEVPPLPEPPVAAPTLRITPAKADTQQRAIFEYPQRATTDVIETTPLNRKKIEGAWQALLDGKRPTLALVGPAGVGKTSILEDLAADKGVGIFTFDGMGARSFDDWVGTTRLTSDAEGRSVTRFMYSAFIEAIRIDNPEYSGKPRVIRIDEVNRSESGSALNVFMPILQQGRLFIPGAGPDQQGETITVDPACLFTFTLNRGIAYGSTVDLDAALIERMQVWIRLEVLTEDEEVLLAMNREGVTEAQARPLVQAAAKVREIASRGDIKIGISTRRLLTAARFVSQYGFSLREAAEACWVDSFEEEGGGQSQRGLVLLAINSVLPL